MAVSLALIRKFSDRLIKIIFLVKVKTAIRYGIKSRLGIMGFGTRDTISGQWFFSLTVWFFSMRSIFTELLTLRGLNTLF